MARALYGPSGYYTTPRPILGARGDFTTTPKLTKALAQSIAAWILEKWSHFGKPLPVIELGPGDGSLAADIRAALPFLQRRKLHYHLVEISPHLRERQKKRLGKKPHWHATLTEALEKTDSEALIISNEFFDAFPVRIFRKSADGFEELHLDGLREHWQKWPGRPAPSPNLPTSTLFDQFWPENQRLEIAESIHQWIKKELSRLKKGAVLTIDYGGTATEIYHRRPAGTLRAYAHHQLLWPPDAYRNPGQQDLTFDVNFDDLIAWGREISLHPSPLRSQAEFSPQATLGGAGESFQVLEQHLS